MHFNYVDLLSIYHLIFPIELGRKKGKGGPKGIFPKANGKKKELLDASSSSILSGRFK